MPRSITDSDLEGYLDEALPIDEMARVEQALRGDPALAARLSMTHARRDSGVHTLGEIWRRHRLTCPSRDQLGSYLLGVLPEEHARYIAFHIDEVGCRYCQANLNDLREQPTPATVDRRRKYFQSSAGLLRGKS